MGVFRHMITINENDNLSFGNYKVKEKQKVDGFEYKGDTYKCKTHKDITRLEKNEMLVIETVPGATVHDFVQEENGMTYLAEGVGETKITMELAEGEKYEIKINDKVVGETEAQFGGKIILSNELTETPVKISVLKK